MRGLLSVLLLIALACSKDDNRCKSRCGHAPKRPSRGDVVDLDAGTDSGALMQALIAAESTWVKANPYGRERTRARRPTTGSLLAHFDPHNVLRVRVQGWKSVRLAPSVTADSLGLLDNYYLAPSLDEAFRPRVHRGALARRFTLHPRRLVSRSHLDRTIDYALVPVVSLAESLSLVSRLASGATSTNRGTRHLDNVDVRTTSLRGIR
ncbi:MAG: hypothetical protein ACI9KE_000695 [Polyangiales bacterium]|jgi:hypothetical protein